MKLVFVRHGKDDDRYRGGWNQLDILLEGVEQSRKLARYYYSGNINCWGIHYWFINRRNPWN